MSIDAIWLHWPGTYVRLTTVATAAVMFAAITWRTRRPGLALVAVIGWLAAYEIAWEAGQVAFGRDPLRPVIWLDGALVGWVLAVWAIGIRPNPALAVVAVLALAAWWVTGYQQNWPAHPVNLGAESLNVLSKTAAAAAFLLGATRLRAAPRASSLESLGRPRPARPSTQTQPD